MAASMTSSLTKQAFAGKALAAVKPRTSAARGPVVIRAEQKLWAPGVECPDYLAGKAGSYGWDPLRLGSDPERLVWYQQAELQNARWAMLGVAGILGQEILKPDVWWYSAGLPENVPDLEYGGKFNLGGILAWEFLLMHWVEVRRWQDIKKHGSVNQDPIFSGNKLSNPELGYPGFDPVGLFNGDKESLKTKELKNGRLAMVAFVGFTIQAQATGKGPLGALAAHLSNPFGDNISTNIGHCVLPKSVDVQGITLPLTCLWPGQY